MISVLHTIVLETLTTKIATIMGRKTLIRGILETMFPLFKTAQIEQLKSLVIIKQAQRHHQRFESVEQLLA